MVAVMEEVPFCGNWNETVADPVAVPLTTGTR
jgi:hypothetical protein